MGKIGGYFWRVVYTRSMRTKLPGRVSWLMRFCNCDYVATRDSYEPVLRVAARRLTINDNTSSTMLNLV